MFDALFETPLAEYEDLYASYFRTYCSSAVASDDNAHRGSMLPTAVRFRTPHRELQPVLRCR